MITEIIQLTKKQRIFLDKIMTSPPTTSWFIANFGELTLSQLGQIILSNHYTNLDKSLLNHIRERYINDFTI